MNEHILRMTATAGGKSYVPAGDRPKPAALKLHSLGPNLYLWTCSNCSWQLEATTDEPIEHRCGVTQVVRLGDRIEAAFDKIGVTKEKYREWKEVLGLPPACRCKERKEWLNRLDEKVGLGEKVAEFKNLMGW